MEYDLLDCYEGYGFETTPGVYMKRSAVISLSQEDYTQFERDVKDKVGFGVKAYVEWEGNMKFTEYIFPNNIHVKVQIVE